MAPIRIAIIGLSASATTSWASAAHLPYLLSPRGLARFKIIALCNSSTAAARAAVEAFHLPPETRAYGSPEELAADADVELVVCSTRVDVHAPTVRPVLAAGKMVFCEWPLAHNIDAVRELAGLAREMQVRTMVGVQGRVAPVVKKLKAVLEDGRIGRVVSVEVRAAGGLNDREVLPQGLEYFTKREVGGNVFTIGLGHLWDQIQFVHGHATAIQSRLHLQFPENKLRDPPSNTIVRTVTSNVPDLVIAAGAIPESPTTQPDAPLLVRFRRGQPAFDDEPPLVWSVTGETGEIRLTSPAGTGLGASSHTDDVKLEVRDFATGKVERIEWRWEDWQEELPLLGRSIAALYEAFADGEGGYPTFQDALQRHEQLEAMLVAWDSQK
ncbi:hypothetical protein C8F01DRAFT_1014937 [Mycena amicta]|nr:hypothetical protein C8F01DRAFT_1014937 [Mycena amicta]